ncbi:MAG: 3-keto-disaccharide hydrolase [Actinomycetota bacterium]
MRTWSVRIAAGAVAMAALGLVSGWSQAAGAAGSSKVISLFDGKTMTNWYTFVPGEGKNKDPLGIFKIEDGCFHVSGEKFAFLSTEKEYDNYRFSVDFKWGQKKWPPRENAVRDAGILYHCVGPDKVWNKSLELQIQEGDTGDMWLTSGEGGPPSLEVVGKNYVGGRVVKFADYEKPTGQWNTVVVVAKGNRIEHWVNGKVNMVGKNASLTRGRINLQSEGAEIWYRNPTIELLN